MAKENKYFIRLLKVKENEDKGPIEGKVERVKVLGASTQRKKGGYRIKLCLESVTYKGSRQQLEELFHEYEFGLLLMRHDEEIIGEYDVQLDKGAEDRFIIYEGEDGRINIECKVISYSLITNKVLNLWNVWCGPLEKNMWKDWRKTKVRDWLELCRNHQYTHDHCYEKTHSHLKKVSQIYLDGTYVNTGTKLSCALADAVFGPGGYYGDYDKGDGFGYLHDRVALTDETILYWENFNATVDDYLLIIYYLSLMTCRNDAGMEAMLSKGRARSLEQLEAEGARKIYMDGIEAKDTVSILEALGEAIADDKNFFNGKLVCLKNWLEKETKDKKLILVWISYATMWHKFYYTLYLNHESEKADKLSKEIVECIQIFINYNVYLVFTPVFSQLQRSESKEAVKQLIHKEWYSPECKAFLRSNGYHNYFLRQFMELSIEDYKKIVLSKEMERKNLDIGQMKKMLESDDGIKQLRKDTFSGVWQVELENLGEVLLLGIKRLYIEEWIKRWIFQYGEEQVIVSLATTYKRLSNGEQVKCKSVSDEEWIDYIKYMVQEAQDKKNFEQIMTLIKDSTLQIRKGVKIALLTAGYKIDVDKAFYFIKDIDTTLTEEERISDVLDFVLNDQKSIKPIAYEYCGLENEILINLECDPIRRYYMYEGRIGRYLEQYGEYYRKILTKKLKEHLYSDILWQFYFRMCKQSESVEELKEVRELVNSLDEKILHGHTFYTKQFKNKIIYDDDERKEFREHIKELKVMIKKLLERLAEEK